MNWFKKITLNGFILYFFILCLNTARVNAVSFFISVNPWSFFWIRFNYFIFSKTNWKKKKERNFWLFSRNEQKTWLTNNNNNTNILSYGISNRNLFVSSQHKSQINDFVKVWGSKNWKSNNFKYLFRTINNACHLFWVLNISVCRQNFFISYN